MPKNPLKNFRRRSSGNALDLAPQPEAPAPAQSSFRVLERPEKAPYGRGDGFQKKLTGRTFDSPLTQLRGKSVEELGLGANRWVQNNHNNNQTPALRRVRGSGGTTNSGSSGYYESSSASARYSSSSTLPSSLDAEHEPEEELYPRKVSTAPAPMYQNVGNSYDDPPLPPPPSFTQRAGRALSFAKLGHQRNANSISTKVPTAPSSPDRDHPTSPNSGYSAHRDRALTTSSYASTAVPTSVQPPRLDASLGASDFGGNDDFGNMFSGIEKRKSADSSYDDGLHPPSTMGGFHRSVRALENARSSFTNQRVQESEPMFPPRAHSRQGRTPSPNHRRSDDAGSPYSWNGRNSNDGLMSNSALNSPKSETAPAPPHHGGFAPAFLGGKPGYQMVPERYTSPGPDRESRSSWNSGYGDRSTGSSQEMVRDYQTPSNRHSRPEVDDWRSKRHELTDAQRNGLSEQSSNASFHTSASSAESSSRRQVQPQLGEVYRPSGERDAWGRNVGRVASPDQSEEGTSLFGTESRNTTPRAAKLEPRQVQSHESLFDISPSGPASRAIRPGSQHAHPATQESGTPKKMSKAQFELLQRQKELSPAENGSNKSEDSDHEADDFDDDEIERAKETTKLRRKQEANMSVYRQQMKKVTGGQPSALPNSSRPEIRHASASAPVLSSGMSGIHLGGIDGQPPGEVVMGRDDEDEDVPLGILQAHGFPNKTRPPTRSGEVSASPGRAPSVAGSVIASGAGQGNLPPFARRLPADPYFGASLVNPPNRESLAFGGAGSVYGGAEPRPMGQPGGLVGVIAGEERARAARRGSPNAQGGYGPIPLPSNYQMPQQMPRQMPPMGRTMSMGSMMSPMGGMVPQNPMGMPMMSPGMMTPGLMQDPNQQQMQQLMQMQAQLMQQMMAMQQGQMPMQLQMPQMQPQQGNGFLSPQQGGLRPMSMASQAPSMHNQPLNQGRAMTMMGPPPQWGAQSQQQQRPMSAMNNGGYAPSMNGLNVPNGPGPGYTPSIAPSERSNIGMPSRYRPVSTLDSSGRSQSMTSSNTLQAFTNQQGSFNLAGAGKENQPPKSTIRIVDKPKGTPKVSTKQFEADEDDEEGWAEMQRKRDARKRKDKKENKTELALEELYRGVELGSR